MSGKSDADEMEWNKIPTEYHKALKQAASDKNETTFDAALKEVNGLNKALAWLYARRTFGQSEEKVAMNSPRPQVPNLLLQQAEKNVVAVSNVFYLRTAFLGKIERLSTVANAVALGYVTLSKPQAYYMLGTYLVLISNAHVFGPISKKKTFRFLHETTFSIIGPETKKTTLVIKWKIPEDGSTSSIIFISNKINSDICLIFISQNDFMETDWKNFQDELSLKTYDSMDDLCVGQFASYFQNDYDENKSLIECNPKIQKNEYVIVAGQMLFGNWTDEVVSGIGEIVHVSTKYQFIVNLPGKPGLSAGAIYRFNISNQKINLIGIVQGGTIPKIIRAFNFVDLMSFFLKPYTNIPIDYIKFGYNETEKSFISNYLGASKRFFYFNQLEIPIKNYSNVVTDTTDEFEEPKIITNVDDSLIAGTEEW